MGVPLHHRTFKAKDTETGFKNDNETMLRKQNLKEYTYGWDWRAIYIYITQIYSIELLIIIYLKFKQNVPFFYDRQLWSTKPFLLLCAVFNLLIKVHSQSCRFRHSHRIVPVLWQMSQQRSVRFCYFSHPSGATFTTCFNFNPSMDK